MNNGLTREQVRELVLKIENTRRKALGDAEAHDQRNQHLMCCTSAGIVAGHRDVLERLKTMGIDVDAIIEAGK
jgi:hypothetical protein